MNNNKNKKIYILVLTALFAAIITVTTAFIKINTGINDGYVHLGDSIIYLAGCVLPAPYCLISAALGGALADILAGAAVWAPFTAVIKALNALVFVFALKFAKNDGSNKILSVKTALMSFVSGLVTVFGYLLCEGLLYSFPTALTSVPFSIIQATGSALVFILIAAALDKADFKKRFMNFKG